MSDALKVMAIFPHLDDETLGMGAALAKYSAEGVHTNLVCATRGERGWFGPTEQNPGMAELGRIRAGELECAARELGLHEVTLLDYIDGDVDQAAPARIITRLVAEIRRVRPQVVVTFGYDGVYGHPDHIALAQFTAAALVQAAAGGGPAAHQVQKFYHMVDSIDLVAGLREHLGSEIRMEVDGVMRRQIGWEDWAVTTRVEAGAYFERVWRAVLCHRTQLPGFGPLVDLPEAVLRRFFSNGSFIRVYSLVNGGRKVEDDLFAGLR